MKQPKSVAVRKCFGTGWDCVDNYATAVNGRIWAVWDTSKVQFHPISNTAQLLHGYLTSIKDDFACFVTFIYGSNDLDEREILWHDLRRMSGVVQEP